MNIQKLIPQFAALSLLVLIQFGTTHADDQTKDAKTVQKADPVAEQPPAGMLPGALLSMNSETGSFPKRAFLVDKRRRTLTVWEAENDSLKLIGAWPTDIGQAEGDKNVQGDHKTPEGIYFFQTTMDGRKLNFDLYGNRIFTLDYPNYFDKLEKKTGNGIWLHSIPETKSLLRGSRGCVVVRNDVIDQLGQYIDLKLTPMVIVNTVEYLTPEQWREKQTAARGWLEAWRTSWGTKSLDSYMTQYSERFRSNGMNKAAWRRFKQNLAERYKFIEIQVKDAQVFTIGPKIVFRFFQDYKSDQKADTGTKILYTLKSGDAYEIIGENWKPLKQAQIPAPAPASTAAPAEAPAEAPAGASASASAK
jgi:murein L,D-transpeptidase YafK